MAAVRLVGGSREATWVDRARAGEAAALDHIAREQLPRVERLLVRLLGPRADLEDLVQTVFLEMCRALPRFRGDSALSTFVGGITVQVAKRAMRPTAWQRRRTELSGDPAGTTSGPERDAVASAQLAHLHDALGKLTAEKRVAFLLWALEGLRPEEIAELTGASLSATRSRIFYAQKELAALARDDEHLSELLAEDRGNDD